MRNKIALTVLTGIIIYAGLTLLGLYISYKYPVYEGIAVLETEQEVLEFKASLAQENVEIRHLEILTETPTVIDFEVRFWKDPVLSYGEVHYDKLPIIFLPLVVGTTILALVSMGLIWKDN